MTLHVEKYLEEQQQAETSSEYDVLYHGIEVEQDIKEDVQDEVETIAKEEDYQVATEDLSFVSFKEAIVNLAKVGIHYSPILLGKLYKGTVYGISRLISGLISSAQTIADYRVRHQQSFEQLREDIAKLTKVIEQIEPWETEGNYTKLKVINSLKIHDEINLTANITTLTESLTGLVSDLSKSVDNDIGYIQQLVASATSRSIKAPHAVLQTIPLKTYLIEGSIEGYEETSDLVQAFHYDKALPGDITVLAMLPETESDNIDLLTKAYNQSSLYLGFDHSSFIAIESVPYQDKDEIKQFLQALDGLCQQALQHVSFYEHIQKTQRNLKYLFRLYISSITSSQQKVSSKVSLIDYVNLKALFIHRLYLPFSIDLHTYIVRVVRSGLQYTEDHIKQFS